jgi:hypothetical protein
LLLKHDVERAESVLEQKIYGSVAPDEWVAHEAILAVLYQLSEVDREAPRVRSVRLQTFKQNALNLLLDVMIGALKQIV